MTDKRCATCRHWAAAGDPRFEDPSPDWRFVDDIYQGAKRCKRINAQVAEEGAVHGGNAPGDIFTLPTFGCVLFEKKESEVGG